jgi:N-carbamoyl-L-amino-acid hydrolase
VNNLRIDADRLWASLMDLAKIGATDKGGVRRLALTDLDREGRDLFVAWAREAGCGVSVDRMGNIFARRAGREDSLPPVMTGSHLDTQPNGGKFDGAYGVMAGLEVLRALAASGYRTRAPIEVVAWTNEEGSRFAPAMVASGVFAGVFDEAYGLSRADRDGKTIGEELRRIGYAGDAPTGGRSVTAFFEAHIEQGPILEAEGKTIGVVSDVQGARWYDVAFTGQDGHAGATPMERRRDAMLGAARLIDRIDRIGRARAPDGRATVGVVDALPGSRNTVPGLAKISVDIRHPDARELAAMDADLRRVAAAIAAEHGLGLQLDDIWHSPPVAFDKTCVDAVRRAAARNGFPARDMVSGAGHDAVYLSRIAPTAMVFVPCTDGLSHNEAEDAKPADLAAGCQVLLEAIVETADRA